MTSQETRQAAGPETGEEPGPETGIRIEGAAENNLRDVDVTLSPGITAVVGASGSGKSSLVFDTLHREARHRFLATLAGAPATARAARVRAVHGLRPAVGVGQNVLNRNPRSTVATAAGAHPFLRVLYARFAVLRCPRCAQVTETVPAEEQLSLLRTAASAGPVEVLAPLVRGALGSHARLLAALLERFGTEAVAVDGRPWNGRPPAPDVAHTITVRVGTLGPDDDVRAARRLLDQVAALGSAQVELRTSAGSRVLSRARLCTSCGAPLPRVRPQDFRAEAPGTQAYELAGLTLPSLLALDVSQAREMLAGVALPPHAATPLRQVLRRLEALESLGLGYLALDRSSPTLSRGEAQRLRIAVLLANDVEDLLHILDEPTIGLGAAQVARLMTELGRLAGPVVLVEHDRTAVAAADRVVEIGPEAGTGGGRVVFEGTPAELWEADTVSGRWFSGREHLATPAPAPDVVPAPAPAPDVVPAPAPDVVPAPGPEALGAGTRWLTVRNARHHNLTGFDCSFPAGALTVVTGPSGAGKSTLVRDVLVASLVAGEPRGCDALEGEPLVPLSVDQSPIGVNPRSNPATYTGLADRIRAVLAEATGLPAGTFSFNRSEGACPDCAGMGSVEVKLRFLPSEWVRCEACGGRRFGTEALAVRAQLPDGNAYSVDEIHDLSVREALPLFAHDARARRIIQALLDVGLGYLRLGQPSPTLSGGEAQRVKLAKQIAATKPAQLVYLDEPSTGLHPADVPRLTALLRRLTERGCTVVVVEHNRDVAAMADWTLRIGPGSGPDGGRLLHAGPPERRDPDPVRPAGAPRRPRRAHTTVEIRGARANNLRDVSVDIPKGMTTAVTGVSGSGKSSLVRDVLEAEATRRLLESLSLYERQSVREGPESGAASLTGLGPTLVVGADGRAPGPRSTVGSTTDLSPHLGVLLAYAGARVCPDCGAGQRRSSHQPGSAWTCAGCGRTGPPAEPADFSPLRYEAACLRCHGMGGVAVPLVDRLVHRPDRPLMDGALYSPGFYPRSYLSKPANGGYWQLLALGERYGFDPARTLWRDMSTAAQEAFLFGEEEVTLSPEARVTPSATVLWRGVFRIMDGWDVGGLYTERVPCPECDGGRLRREFLDQRIAGLNRYDLHREPVDAVREALAGLRLPDEAPGWAVRSHAVALSRLGFLGRVGLGHLHLDRMANTLSAGELQRVRLTALLGAELTGMTVLLDEPSRGLHPREVDVLATVLEELRDRGNTVILVDHDSRVVERADHRIVMGPGAGRHGGTVVAAGTAARVRENPEARALLDRPLPARATGPRAEPTGWLTVRKPTENHLDGEDVRIPLGVLSGLCGVSGSGKSTLAIGILARALAPKKLTTSAAATPVAPGAHEGIDGAPKQVRHTDQSGSGITSPGAFLKVLGPLRERYAASAEGQERGIGAADLQPRCDGCKGRGKVAEDMGFLPTVHRPCDACGATGYRAEARELVVRGHTLPALERLGLEEVLDLWQDAEEIARPLRGAVELGLGYLTLGQAPGALSGGERQRLKLVRDITGPGGRPALYILDEPTTGLHDADVERLVGVLDALVARGHGVLVVDHDPRLLACCDWLVEFGPGGGPAGGRTIAEGTPEQLAAGDTPTAPYLREVLS
ncbi:hypothetical protein [Streptomyces sp. NPDC046182]|uniref:hypothetical protein n=1 Tax=Streptomyces sp. NPDC046182 TaxID=3154601 RepID=UPI0033C7913C